MTTALTVLLWLIAAWIFMGICGACFAAYRIWKESRR